MRRSAPRRPTPASVALAPPCAWKTSRSCCARSRRSPRRSAIRTALVAVPEAGRAVSIAALAQLSAAPAARRRLPDRHRRRPAVRRPVPVHARRRGRAVPGVGDAAVRAGQPERGDDGPPPRGALAAARPRARPGDRRRRRPRPAAAPRPGGDRRSSRSACARGDVLDPDDRAAPPRASSATGASSSSSTAARWRCAARSSTSTRRPPTPRSASTCGATRSTG